MMVFDQSENKSPLRSKIRGSMVSSRLHVRSISVRAGSMLIEVRAVRCLFVKSR